MLNVFIPHPQPRHLCLGIPESADVSHSLLQYWREPGWYLMLWVCAFAFFDRLHPGFREDFQEETSMYIISIDDMPYADRDATGTS